MKVQKSDVKVCNVLIVLYTKLLCEIIISKQGVAAIKIETDGSYVQLSGVSHCSLSENAWIVFCVHCKCRFVGLPNLYTSSPHLALG